MPEPKKQRTFRVNHTQVGPWENGRVITEADIRRRGSTPEELMRAKVGDSPAIVETTEAPTETSVPLGPLNEFPPPTANPPATPATIPPLIPPIEEETMSETTDETRTGTSVVPPERAPGTGTRVVTQGKGNTPPK